jgi:hypothetical protein
MFLKRNRVDIKMINPSSKVSLKLSCLASCKGDVEQATKLYNFLADGIESIPDFDTPTPSTFEQIKQGASQIFKFVKENRQEIVQGYNFIQSLRSGQSIAEEPLPTQEIPPLPDVSQAN